MAPKNGEDLDLQVVDVSAGHSLCRYVKEHEKVVYNLQDDVRQLQVRAERIEAAIHDRASSIEDKLNSLNTNIEQLKNFMTYFIAKDK